MIQGCAHDKEVGGGGITENLSEDGSLVSRTGWKTVMFLCHVSREASWKGNSRKISSLCKGTEARRVRMLVGVRTILENIVGGENDRQMEARLTSSWNA